MGRWRRRRRRCSPVAMDGRRNPRVSGFGCFKLSANSGSLAPAGTPCHRHPALLHRARHYREVPPTSARSHCSSNRPVPKPSTCFPDGSVQVLSHGSDARTFCAHECATVRCRIPPHTHFPTLRVRCVRANFEYPKPRTDADDFGCIWARAPNRRVRVKLTHLNRFSMIAAIPTFSWLSSIANENSASNLLGTHQLLSSQNI